MFVSLSHTLNSRTPTYGKRNNFIISKKKTSNSRGKASGCLLTFHNHTGTHVDFPSHFIKNGKNFSNYNQNYFIYKKILIINLKKIKPSYLISIKDIKNQKLTSSIINKKKNTIDFILFKTNFERFREKDKYIFYNPGIDPLMGEFLKKNFPKLKAIGFDFISLSSFQNSEEGKKAHIEFLKRGILIYEDMKLKFINKDSKIKKIFCFPLPVEEIDGSPCSILAQI
jgi:kynurenine formamidase